MASAANANLNAVRETMDVLLEISRLLNTGLDMESLSICVRLCEQGINPEALSAVIKELRKASESLKASENCTNWSCTLINSGNFDGIMPHCWICTYHGLANQICLSVCTLSSHFVTNCSCFLLLLVSQFFLFFFLKVWTSSPLPKQYSYPYISVSSYILPQIWVCSKSLLLFVKCKLRVALALTSCLNLKAYLLFLSVNLCCTFHKKMVFFMWIVYN